ncbi:MAG TPA: type II secretion system protein GspM [Steroidobacteraceae bacterium]|nr:type II secretion system protein GspM [Steroidobacteraceae bacterium]
MNNLRAWYASQSERDRRVLLIGAVTLAVLILVLGVLLPLQSAVSGAVGRTASRREDLDWVRMHAQEVREGATQLRRDTGEAPVVLVDRVGHESGLGEALRGTQPAGVAGVRVQLEGAPFDTLVVWLATLEQRYGLAIESITIDRTAQTGLVNVSVTLTQSQH